VTGEIPQALAPRKLIVRPTESEHPGAAINYAQYFSLTTKLVNLAFF